MVLNLRTAKRRYRLRDTEMGIWGLPISIDTLTFHCKVIASHSLAASKLLLGPSQPTNTGVSVDLLCWQLLADRASTVIVH